MARSITILDQEFTLYRVEGASEPMVLDPCWKCGGDRILTHYLHVFGGECFACRATGGTYLTVEGMTKRIKGRQQRAAAKVRKAGRVEEARKAGIADFILANEDLVFMVGDAVFDDELDIHPILRDMGRRLQETGKLSEKQVAFARKLVTEAQEKQVRREAEKAMAQPAPTGRVVIEGLVVKAVENVSYFGGSEQYSTKITVKTDAGWLTWGTAHSDLLVAVRDENLTPEEAIKGRRVRFTATVTPKDSDPTFSFFKRPAKGAQVIKEEEVDLD